MKFLINIIIVQFFLLSNIFPVYSLAPAKIKPSIFNQACESKLNSKIKSENSDISEFYNKTKNWLGNIKNSVNEKLRYDRSVFFRDYFEKNENIGNIETYSEFEKHWKDNYSIDQKKIGCCLEYAFAAHKIFEQECRKEDYKQIKDIFGDIEIIEERLSEPEKSISYYIKFKTEYEEIIELSSYMFGFWKIDMNDINAEKQLEHFAVCVQFKDKIITYTFLLDPTSTDITGIAGNLDKNNLLFKRDINKKYKLDIEKNLVNQDLVYIQPDKITKNRKNELISSVLNLSMIKKYFIIYTQGTYFRQNGDVKKGKGENSINIFLLGKKIRWINNSKESFIDFKKFKNKKNKIAKSLGVSKKEKKKWEKSIIYFTKNSDKYIKDIMLKKEITGYYEKKHIKISDEEIEKISLFLLKVTKEFFKRNGGKGEVFRFKFDEDGNFGIIFYGDNFYQLLDAMELANKYKNKPIEEIINNYSFVFKQKSLKEDINKHRAETNIYITKLPRNTKIMVYSNARENLEKNIGQEFGKRQPLMDIYKKTGSCANMGVGYGNLQYNTGYVYFYKDEKGNGKIISKDTSIWKNLKGREYTGLIIFKNGKYNISDIRFIYNEKEKIWNVEEKINNKYEDITEEAVEVLTGFNIYKKGEEFNNKNLRYYQDPKHIFWFPYQKSLVSKWTMDIYSSDLLRGFLWIQAEITDEKREQVEDVKEQALEGNYIDLSLDTFLYYFSGISSCDGKGLEELIDFGRMDYPVKQGNDENKKIKELIQTARSCKIKAKERILNKEDNDKAKKEFKETIKNIIKLLKEKDIEKMLEVFLEHMKKFGYVKGKDYDFVLNENQGKVVEFELDETGIPYRIRYGNISQISNEIGIKNTAKELASSDKRKNVYLRIKLKKGVYPENALGITESGRLVSVQVRGSLGQKKYDKNGSIAGCDFEELNEIFKDLDVKTAIILDNGNDANRFLWNKSGEVEELGESRPEYHTMILFKFV